VKIGGRGVGRDANVFCWLGCRRAAKTFNFVKEGTYVKQAEQVRAREAKKMLAGFTSGRNPRGYQKEAIVAIDDDDAVAEASVGSSKTEVEAMEIHDIEVPPRPASLTPDVEWWDIEFLPKDQRAMVDKFGFVKAKVRAENAAATVSYADMKLKFSSTFHVVEHPARLSVIVKKDDQPVALPLMLTAAERKKIRRQNRAEREKEKQDKITLGLLPPPEPKVKLSNMMRVLSEQAVADPSAIERKVREQVAQREKNHEMRNLARKLTPEERREKKLRKIKEDAAGDIHVAVFKYVSTCDDDDHRHHRRLSDTSFLQGPGPDKPAAPVQGGCERPAVPLDWRRAHLQGRQPEHGGGRGRPQGHQTLLEAHAAAHRLAG